MGRVKDAMLDLAYEISSNLKASDTGREWLNDYNETMDETYNTSDLASVTADHITDGETFEALCALVPGLKRRASEWFELVVYALVTVYQWQL